MRNMFLSGYLLAFLLHLSSYTVNSLSCYQCDSSEDIRCAEELISRDLRSLPCNSLSEPRYCVKMTGLFGVSALKCYQCSSIDEYTCGEFFDTSTTNAELTECKLSNAQYCVKTTGIFDGNLGAKRFCSERFLDNYCTYVQRPGDQREYRSCVYTCTIDGCNGSTSLNPFSWVTFISLTLLLTTYLVTFQKF